MGLVLCFSFTCLEIHKSTSKLALTHSLKTKSQAFSTSSTIMLMPAAERASYPHAHTELLSLPPFSRLMLIAENVPQYFCF